MPTPRTAVMITNAARPYVDVGVLRLATRIPVLKDLVIRRPTPPAV
jgi:hypothetical protein